VDREPAFERVRRVLETQPAAKQFMLECRTQNRATHNSCHLVAAQNNQCQAQESGNEKAELSTDAKETKPSY